MAVAANPTWKGATPGQRAVGTAVGSRYTGQSYRKNPKTGKRDKQNRLSGSVAGQRGSNSDKVRGASLSVYEAGEQRKISMQSGAKVSARMYSSLIANAGRKAERRGNY